MKPENRHRSTWAAVVITCALAAGCAALAPPSLSLGTSMADARRSLGAPTGQYALADGGTRLEYGRAPYGQQTWMVDFDAQGGFTQATQVLTEARFNRILKGMTRDELLTTLGHPSEQSVIGLQRQTVWSYRFAGHFCQWFQVGINGAGRVADTGYYPDPNCDHRDPAV